MSGGGKFTEIGKEFSLNAEKIKIDSKKERLKITGNKKNVIDGKDGVSMEKYDIVDKKKEEPYKENVFFYETDGHYSTVYLVCLMLGMAEASAEELAIATENPDTDIHSETDFEIDQTWAYAEDQENIHSLTGGFHGTEEFLTALKFLYTMKVSSEGDTKEEIHKKTINRLGELLHRFGDTYAHAKFDNLKPSDLVSYNLKDKKENEKIAIENWKGKGGEKLSDKIEPWIVFINYYTDKYGYAFLTNEKYQREAFKGKTLKEELKEIYLIKPTDKFIMYGGKKKKVLGISTGVTGDHFETDGGYPDLIYMRPEWYLCYVKNLAWMISKRFALDLKKLDISVFEKMVNFVIGKKCSMKGIIDYEISKKRGKTETYIPVFYAKSKGMFAAIDAIYNTDYLKTAQAVTENTKEYIKQDKMTILNEGKETHHGRVKFHNTKDWYDPTGYSTYDEDYFIIKFKK